MPQLFPPCRLRFNVSGIRSRPLSDRCRQTQCLTLVQLAARERPRGHRAAESFDYLVDTGMFRLAFRGTYHFRLDRVIEHNPCLLHFWSKRGTKLLLQAPYQRLAERSEMRCLNSEVRVLSP